MPTCSTTFLRSSRSPRFLAPPPPPLRYTFLAPPLVSSRLPGAGRQDDAHDQPVQSKRLGEDQDQDHAHEQLRLLRIGPADTATRYRSETRSPDTHDTLASASAHHFISNDATPKIQHLRSSTLDATTNPSQIQPIWSPTSRPRLPRSRWPCRRTDRPTRKTDPMTDERSRRTRSTASTSG